jgi:hypothetical protein
MRMNLLARALVLALFLAPIAALAQFADQQNFLGPTGGAASAQTISVPNATTLADVLGVELRAISGFDTTGSTTLKINTFAAQTLRKGTPAGLVPLTLGDLHSGQLFTFVYDGTQIVVTSGINTVSGAPPCTFRHLTGINNNVTPTTKYDVSWDAASANSASGAQVSTGVPSGVITLDITTGTGGTAVANGMDGSAVTNNTFIYVYAISDGLGNWRVLGSLSPAAPALFPAGYAYYCYAGEVKTNGSAQFYGTRIRGNEVNYVNGGNSLSVLPVIASGALGSSCAGSPNYASVTVVGDIGAAPVWFPSTATVVDVVLEFAGGPSSTALILVAPTSGTVYVNSFLGNGFSVPTSGPLPLSVPVLGRIKLESSAIGVCISNPTGGTGEVQAYGWKNRANAT